jgi:hypothetical protein
MQIPLKNLNIFIILGGLFLIILGYVLMSTENFIDATQFSLSLYVSPPLIVVGHVIIVWGIVFRLRRKDDTSGMDSSDEKFAKARHN